MAEFRLTKLAQRDIEKIGIYLEREASVRVAAHVEDALFAAFEDLVRLPALGHCRDDVRQTELRFYVVFEYVIAFRRESQVVIVRVKHGAQNIARMF